MKVSATGGGGPKIPEGMTEAICVGVYDLGMQVTTGQYAGTYHKLLLLWEVESGELIGKEYTASLSDKSNLRKDLTMWRGRPFTAEELSGFELEKVLGVHCVLQIQHVNNWARVTAIVPSKAKWTQKTKLVNFSINDELPVDCPSWIAKKINAATDRFVAGDSQAPEDGSGIPPADDEGNTPF